MVALNIGIFTRINRTARYSLSQAGSCFLPPCRLRPSGLTMSTRMGVVALSVCKARSFNDSHLNLHKSLSAVFHLLCDEVTGQMVRATITVITIFIIAGASCQADSSNCYTFRLHGFLSVKSGAKRLRSQ